MATVPTPFFVDSRTLFHFTNMVMPKIKELEGLIDR